MTAEARTIVGSYLGSAVPSRDIPKYAELWRQGRLPVEALISSTVSLDDVNAAMDTLLETVEHETGPDPRWSILWLHGLGADGHDFAPIVPELVRPGWPALRFVFPHAPVRAVTINAGMRMRAS